MELTTQQLAERAGVTEQAVLKALRDGRISGTKIDRQWWFPADCVEAFAEKPTDPEGLYHRGIEAKTKMAEAKLALIELQLERERGELISREVVRAEFEEAALDCRNALLAVPAIVAAELSGYGGNPAAIERRLREVIEAALLRASEQPTEDALDGWS